jgi:hypothetical protein
MYYIAKVKVQVNEGKKTKWNTETFLVDAVSVTDAEVKLHQEYEGFPDEWEIRSVSQSPIIKVIV